MIDSGDPKVLAKLPKVGKKIAEQMVLSLKGKIAFVESEAPGKHSDLKSALLNLGFRDPEIERAMRDIPEDLNLEEEIRFCLNTLASP